MEPRLFRHGNDYPKFVMSWKTVNPPMDIQGFEPAVQEAQDGRVVACHVENLESLHIQVAVQGLDKHPPRSEESVEGS